MALDSLLALLKSDVSAVSAVQASNDAASGCNGSATADVSAVANRGLQRPTETPDTADVSPTYQRKAAPLLGCTPDTAATAETRDADSETNQGAILAELRSRQPAESKDGVAPDLPYWRWTITHAPGDVHSHTFTPEATLAQVRSWYPSALDIRPEPSPEDLEAPGGPADHTGG